jgi:putative transposase
MTDELSIYRRRLPHWRIDGAIYFITWRLGRGAPDLAGGERDQVAAALRFFNGARYVLLAYIVMNDHVHVLAQPNNGVALEDLLRSWKSYSARTLRRGGRHVPVWQAEYFDRVMRDAREVLEKVEYICANPFKRWPGAGFYPWLWVDRDQLA